MAEKGLEKSGPPRNPFGILIYSNGFRLFEKNECFRELFTVSLVAEENGEKASSVIETHAVNLIQIFDEAICAIGDPPAFFHIIKKYATVHCNIPKFKAQYLREIEEPFLYAVKIALDEGYSETLDDIYTLVTNIILESMVDECESQMD